VAGTVEGYRERMFKSGDKLAFFMLEDLSGGIEVKVRGRQLERSADMLTSGEPVLVSGKLQFPQVDEEQEAAETAPREPTLLLDEVMLLSDAVRAETKSMAIRLGKDTVPAQIERLADVLRRSPGGCPVQLIIEVEDGAEAILALSAGMRVEPTDTMLASLERLFGRGVAELR
jgi:DNA polymerase-3 subunit alpha